MYFNKRFISNIAICITLLFGTSCKNQLRKASSGVEKSNIENPVINVKANPCYGTCKVYDLTINKDGKCILNAREHFDSPGKYEFVVEQEFLDQLFLKFEEAKFFKKVTKQSLMTDGRSFVLYAKNKGYENTISYQSSNDAELDQLLTFINNFVEGTQWEPSED